MRKNTFIKFEARTDVFMNGIVRVSYKKVVLAAFEVIAPGTTSSVVVVFRETLRLVILAVETLAVVAKRVGVVSAFDA